MTPPIIYASMTPKDMLRMAKLLVKLGSDVNHKIIHTFKGRPALAEYLESVLLNIIAI